MSTVDGSVSCRRAPAPACVCRDIGVVLQNPARNLLAYDTAMGNMAFALRPAMPNSRTRRRWALALLDAVGLAAVGGRRAGRLSGGEQQRLAVAVAVANRPRLLLADEPTSQLDRTSAAAVIDLFRAANADMGTTVVVVTHDADVGDAFGRTITIRDGRVGSEGRAGKEYLVVGRDGTVQLPADALAVLPPGPWPPPNAAAHGVELRPVDRPHEPPGRHE